MKQERAKPRLMFITNSLVSFGGGEKWSLELATRLKHEYAIAILNPTFKNSLTRKSMEEINHNYNLLGIEIINMDCRNMQAKEFDADAYTMALPKLESMPMLISAIASSDIIYQVSSNPLILSYSIIFSRIFGKKLIFGLHNPVFFKAFEKSSNHVQEVMKKSYRLLLKQVKYFHVLNTRDLKIVKREFPTAKLFTIPTYIYQKPPKPKVDRKNFVALYVGRLETSQKGIDMLKEIIEKTLSKNKKIIFHIVGKGGDGERIIEALAKKYCSNVKWLGFTTDEKLVEEYKNASLFVFPSRYEGSPATLLEAQSYGTPAVSFDIEGANDIVTEKALGTLIKQFDKAKFTASILDYYKMWEKQNYQKIKEKVYEMTNKRNSEKIILPKLKKMFEEVKDD